MSQDPEELDPSRPAPDRRRRVGPKKDRDVDVAIGARIRAFRTAAGMSQAALGKAIGLSWQQVQKYESGRDRVSASTLLGLAGALNVPPTSFFEDGPHAPTLSGPDVGIAVKAAVVFQQIGDARVQKRLVDLAKVLGMDAGGGAEVKLRRDEAI